MNGISTSPAWSDLSAKERNLLIAKTIKAELLGQWYLAMDGTPYHPLPYVRDDKLKAEKTFGFVTTPQHWEAHEKDHNLPAGSRERCSLVLFEWPLRYSDTPGGGWDVIEAIRKHCNVQIQSTGDQWMIACNPSGGKTTLVRSKTMEDAACQMALLVFADTTANLPTSTDSK